MRSSTPRANAGYVVIALAGVALIAGEAAAQDHALLGDAAFEQGRFADAVEHYDKAIDLSPAFAICVNLGHSCMRLERWEDAAKAYRAAIALNRDVAGPGVWWFLGQAQYRSGECDAAMDVLELALRIDALRVPEGWRLLADLYLSRDMPREAAALYVRLTAFGGQPTAGDYYRLGLAYCCELEWDSAQVASSVMAELAPTEGSAELDLGHVPREQGAMALTNRAEAHYRAALRKEATHREAMAGLGNLKMRSGDCREAADHFRRAIQLGERSANVLRDHVVSLMHCGEPAETRSAMELALGRHPADPGILRLFDRYIALAGRARTGPLE